MTRSATSIATNSSSTMPVLACANNSSCRKPATSLCSRCELVKYCGAECQRAHWKSHKKDCNSPLLKSTWDPQWFTQNRPPTFMVDNNGPLIQSCGMNKYLCGNTPAFDHIKLADNEGRDFSGELDVLFAASGDLRNVIASVNATETKGGINIVINDQEPYVAIRGVLLLIVFGSLPPAEVAEAALHLWYSPRLPSATMSKLRSLFSEKLDKMRNHLSGADDGLLVTNIQISDKRGMRCALPRSCWKELFLVLDSNISSAEASRMRHNITQLEARRDNRERHLYMIPPQYRLSKARYYEDGLILPFSADRSILTDANPTLFDPRGNGWLLNDSHDPMNCWNIHSVQTTGTLYNLPKNDLYGALNYHLVVQFEEFSKRLQTGNIHITLLACDARQLPASLERSKTPCLFDRIDVSNLTDGGHLGVATVLRTLEPLLKDTSYAFLHSLFMNYTADATGVTANPDKKAMEAAARIMTPRMQRPPRSHVDPILFHLAHMSGSLKDFEELWKTYLELMGIESELRRAKMRIQKIERPYQVKPDERNGDVSEKLQWLELSGLCGHECYVQWVKLPTAHDVD